MKKTIVVEGPDGTGKSTLAAEIAKQTRRELVLLRGRPASFEEMRVFMEGQYEMARRGGTVIDRCTAMSQLVYGVARQEQDLPISFLVNALTSLVGPDVIFIRCDTEYPKHEPEEYDTPEGLAVVANRARVISMMYDVLFSFVRNMNALVLPFDMNRQDAEEVIKTIGRI